jgi:hypothetical protein
MAISRRAHHRFTETRENVHVMKIDTDTLQVPAWIRPLVRHAAALLLALAGPVLMLAALAASWLADSPALGAAGLLGGALLTACGGIGLLWSLGRRR